MPEITKVQKLYEEAEADLQSMQSFLLAAEAEDATPESIAENIQSAQNARESHEAKRTLADELQSVIDEEKKLRGEFTRPTNPLPASTQEREALEEDDGSARRLNADHKPPNWIQGYPAAVQMKATREKMGDNLKAEADFYAETWTKWFTAPIAKDYLESASAKELQALEEGTDAEGGFFVPEEYREIVLHDPGTPAGLFRPYCTPLQTSLTDGYLPTFGSVAISSIAEEAATPDNTPVVGRVQFFIRKFGGKVQISNELLADSMADMPSLIQMVFNEARGRWEDQQTIEGDGTTEPQGLRTSLNTAGDRVDGAAAAPALADLYTWYGGLPAQFRQNSIWATTSPTALLLNRLDLVNANNQSIREAPDEMIFGKDMVLYDGTGWDAVSATANQVIGAIGDSAVFHDRPRRHEPDSERLAPDGHRSGRVLRPLPAGRSRGPQERVSPASDRLGPSRTTHFREGAARARPLFC